MIESATQHYKRNALLGKLLIQRSRTTGRHVFPPRIMLPGDGREDLEWVEASGEGTLYSFTIVAAKSPQPDYNICLVDLAEGPRVMTRLVDAPNDDLAIGRSVRLSIEIQDGEPIILCRLAGESRDA